MAAVRGSVCELFFFLRLCILQDGEPTYQLFIWCTAQSDSRESISHHLLPVMEHAVVVFLHKLKGQEDVSRHRVAGGKMVLEVFSLEKKKKKNHKCD